MMYLYWLQDNRSEPESVWLFIPHRCLWATIVMTTSWLAILFVIYLRQDLESYWRTQVQYFPKKASELGKYVAIYPFNSLRLLLLFRVIYSLRLLGYGPKVHTCTTFFLIQTKTPYPVETDRHAAAYCWSPDNTSPWHQKHYLPSKTLTLKK